MGPVVVDATGEVFGDAPNVAARTQAAAEPGTADNGEGEVRTWLMRLRADLLAEDDPSGAEAGYRDALRLAAEQGSPVLVLLAALSLARFLNARGRAAEAYDTLSPALVGFSPTPHLPAVAEAQALIESLT